MQGGISWSLVEGRSVLVVYESSQALLSHSRRFYSTRKVTLTKFFPEREIPNTSRKKTLVGNMQKMLPARLGSSRGLLVLTLTILTGAHIYLVEGTYTNTNPERAVVDSILSDYSESTRYSRPVVNASRPVWVTFGLVVNRVIKFEENRELLTVVGWSRTVWHDEFLPWNINTTGVLTVRMPSKRIWTPDIHSYNGVEKTLFEPHVVLNAEGLALWVVQKEYAIPCIRNPDNRIQWTCRLRVSSATYDSGKLALHSLWHSVDLSSYEGHGHVTITSTVADRDDTVWPCCAQPYPSTSVVFTILIDTK